MSGSNRTPPPAAGASATQALALTPANVSGDRAMGAPSTDSKGALETSSLEAPEPELMSSQGISTTGSSSPVKRAPLSHGSAGGEGDLRSPLMANSADFGGAPSTTILTDNFAGVKGDPSMLDSSMKPFNTHETAVAELGMKSEDPEAGSVARKSDVGSELEDTSKNTATTGSDSERIPSTLPQQRHQQYVREADDNHSYHHHHEDGIERTQGETEENPEQLYGEDDKSSLDLGRVTEPAHISIELGNESQQLKTLETTIGSGEPESARTCGDDSDEETGSSSGESERMPDTATYKHITEEDEDADEEAEKGDTVSELRSKITKDELRIELPFDDDNDDAESDSGSVVEVDEESETGSVVEVEISDDCASDAGENAASVEHPKYATLANLVNDRTAEASMNLHSMTGRDLLRTLGFCFLGNLIALILTAISISWTRKVEEDYTKDSLNVVLFWLIIRVLQSFWMTAVVIFFSYIVASDLESPDILATDQSKLRVRKTSQAVVLLCAWCTWLLPSLNPAATITDLYAFVIARQTSSLQYYLQFWPRQRYSVAADAIFVASFFYGVIVLFKWIRIEAIKREKWLRISLQHDGTSSNMQAVTESLVDDQTKGQDHVRSVKGIVPRAAVVYVVFRLAFGEAFNFSMGFVPGTAWISLIRYCRTLVPVGTPSPCSTYDDNVLTALIVIFSAWELVLVAWIFFEARRARNILSLYYLLQGRANLVSFHVLVTVFSFQMFFLYLLAISSESGLAQMFAFYNGLDFSGVSYGDGPVAIVVLTWITALVYMFLPCDWTLTPRCWKRVRDTGYHYMKSYNEFAMGALGDTYVVDHLDVLSEDKEHTEFSSTEMAPGDYVTADAINHCLEHRASNFFSFDIAALLWNFAHTMYLTGTARFAQSDPDVLLLIEDEQFALVAQISDESVNAYCAVFASSEMIVIAFRGNGSRIPANFVGAQVPRMTQPFEQHSDGSSDPAQTLPSRSLSRMVRMSSSISSGNTATGSTFPFPVINSNFCTWFFRNLGASGPYFAKSSLVRGDVYERYSVVSDRVMTVVQRLLEQKSRPIFTTGHGLGGAYASLCALELARKKQDIGARNIAVYSFGSPRIGNLAFKRAYNELVGNHFDIANVSDALHTHRESCLPWETPPLARLGTLVLVDSLGNLVLRPDWLETHIMRVSKRQKFNGHEPLAYTTALMQWAHRMHGSQYRPLWTSSLHEVKLRLSVSTSAAEVARMVPKEDEESPEQIPQDVLEGWQASVIRSYLRTSQVGLGPYFEEACIRLRVLRITGLHADTSSCIVSCGPQGISSSLWEVGKTKPERLQHRSTLAGLELTSSANSPDSSLSRKSSKSNVFGLGVDAAALAAMPTRFVDFTSSEPMYFGVMQKLRPCATLIIAGVDVAHGNFGSVCLPITELFPIPLDKPKAVSFELTGRARREYAGELKVHIEVENVGHIPLGALASTQHVTPDPLATAPSQSHIQARHRTSLSGGIPRFRHNTDDEAPEVSSRLPSAGTLQLSQPMAYFYLKRNFNGNLQRVILRVGIMKAALRTLRLVAKDGSPAQEIYAIVRLGKETGRLRGSTNIHSPQWNELFTFGKLEPLTGFEELQVEFYASSSNGYAQEAEFSRSESFPDDLHRMAHLSQRSYSAASNEERPSASHRRGHAIGEGNVQSVDSMPIMSNHFGSGVSGGGPSRFASWGDPQLSFGSGGPAVFPLGSTSLGHSSMSQSQFSSEPGRNDRLLGVVELPFSTIISDYQDTMVEHQQDAVLVQWESFEPTTSRSRSATDSDEDTTSLDKKSEKGFGSPSSIASSSKSISLESSSISKLSKNTKHRQNKFGELPGHVCFAFELTTEPLTSEVLTPKVRPGLHVQRPSLHDGRENIGSPRGKDSSGSGGNLISMGSSGSLNGGNIISGNNASGSGTSLLSGPANTSSGSPGVNMNGGGANSTINNSGTSTRRRTNMVRQASGSLRTFMSLATNPMTVNFRSNRSHSAASSVSTPDAAAATLHRSDTFEAPREFFQLESHSILSQSVPEDWRTKSSSNFDERAFVVRVHVFRADQLDIRPPEGSSLGESPRRPSVVLTSSLDSQASIDLPCVDSYCEVSLLDPLNGFEKMQSRKTVVIRDSITPAWDESFSFGKDRTRPIRGNEILSFAVYNWEMNGKSLPFGEVRLPMSKLQESLGMKCSFTEPLERYDEAGNLISRSGAVPDISFAILVTEFVTRDNSRNSLERPETSKSPML